MSKEEAEQMFQRLHSSLDVIEEKLAEAEPQQPKRKRWASINLTHIKDRFNTSWY